MEKKIQSILALILKGEFKPEKYNGQLLDVLERRFGYIAPVRKHRTKSQYEITEEQGQSAELKEGLESFIRKYALGECSYTVINHAAKTLRTVRFTKNRHFKQTERGIYGAELETAMQKHFETMTEVQIDTNDPFKQTAEPVETRRSPVRQRIWEMLENNNA